MKTNIETRRATRLPLIQKLGDLLTGPTSQTEPEVTSNAIPGVEVEVSSTPNSFEDFAAEGDEPADMALTDLVPIELAAFNLPQFQSAERHSERIAGTDSAEAANLINELVPSELTQLNLQPKSSRPKSSKSNSTPLPDLASLTRASENTEPTETTTIRVPKQHIDQLNTIIQDLLDHHSRQSRHNEQLGALVKQLLGQMAGQQSKGDRGNYQAIQTAVQDCLANAVS